MALTLRAERKVRVPGREAHSAQAWAPEGDAEGAAGAAPCSAELTFLGLVSPHRSAGVHQLRERPGCSKHNRKTINEKQQQQRHVFSQQVPPGQARGQCAGGTGA